MTQVRHTFSVSWPETSGLLGHHSQSAQALYTKDAALLSPISFFTASCRTTVAQAHKLNKEHSPTARGPRGRKPVSMGLDRTCTDPALLTPTLRTAFTHGSCAQSWQVTGLRSHRGHSKDKPKCALTLNPATLSIYSFPTPTQYSKKEEHDNFSPNGQLSGVTKSPLSLDIFLTNLSFFFLCTDFLHFHKNFLRFIHISFSSQLLSFSKKFSYFFV